jgi:hypothetical protein
MPILNRYVEDKLVYLLGCKVLSHLLCSHPRLTFASQRLLQQNVSFFLVRGMRRHCDAFVSRSDRYQHLHDPFVCSVCTFGCIAVHNLLHEQEESVCVDAKKLFKSEGLLSLLFTDSPVKLLEHATKFDCKMMISSNHDANKTNMNHVNYKYFDLLFSELKKKSDFSLENGTNNDKNDKIYDEIVENDFDIRYIDDEYKVLYEQKRFVNIDYTPHKSSDELNKTMKFIFNVFDLAV